MECKPVTVWEFDTEGLWEADCAPSGWSIRGSADKTTGHWKLSDFCLPLSFLPFFRRGACGSQCILI